MRGPHLLWARFYFTLRLGCTQGLKGGAQTPRKSSANETLNVCAILSMLTSDGFRSPRSIRVRCRQHTSGLVRTYQRIPLGTRPAFHVFTGNRVTRQYRRVSRLMAEHPQRRSLNLYNLKTILRRIRDISTRDCFYARALDLEI